MARMTLKAVHGDGERRRLTLSERIVDQNLGSYRHVPQRPRSPTAYAQALEPPSANPAEDHHDNHAGHAHVDDQDARRNRHRPHGSEHDEELVDAAWLYAWSYADLRASRGVRARTTHRGRLSRLGTRRG
jgi:hypothetical protein